MSSVLIVDDDADSRELVARHLANDVARDLGVRCIFLKASYELADLLDCVNRLRVDPQATYGGLMAGSRARTSIRTG